MAKVGKKKVARRSVPVRRGKSSQAAQAKKAKTRRTSHAQSGDPPDPPGDEVKIGVRHVRIRARRDNVLVTLEPTLDKMRAELKYWTEAIRRRLRFAGGQASRERQANLARGTLETEFGGNPNELDALADAWRRRKVLEIEFAYNAPHEFFELPWEYVLTAGLDTDVSGLVVRRLRGLSGSREPALDDGVESGLYIECQAGTLTDRLHWFEEERKLDLWLRPGSWHALPKRVGSTKPILQESPTPDDIRKATAKICPQLIHVAGYDGQDGYRNLVRLGYSPPQPPLAGLSVADPKAAGGMSFIDALEAADLLCAGQRPPDIVGFSINRSAELALEAVRAGALAAIGRDGEWEDAEDATEQLHREIYRVLGLNVDRKSAMAKDGSKVEAPWPFTLLQALLAGLRSVRRLSPVITGTGIVIYTRSPIIDGVEDLEDPIPPPDGVLERTKVDVVAIPNADVNYAMLHNGRSLFQRLHLRRQDPGAATVTIEVKLTVGNEPFVYNDTVTVDARIVDLTNRVIVPLGWIKDRMPGESVRTTLVVRAKGATPASQYFPVCLLPIDSWRDDDTNRQWLPSFIAPRDPAVLAVIGRARSYLHAITDDASAGFSGYQEPQRIEAQVRAIWTALVASDFQYVNPPPSYTLGDQRVRSPSRIFTERRGTCLDLALLLAACLEAVEIYPVIFLLQGHAFVGYWQSEDAFDEFSEGALLGPGDTEGPFEAAWLFGASWYKRVRALCRDRRVLVPLEATYLTSRASFQDAVTAGLENLRSQRDFHSMLDIWTARDHRVTPLPILEPL